jgi:hypothetical protein
VLSEEEQLLSLLVGDTGGILVVPLGEEKRRQIGQRRGWERQQQLFLVLQLRAP